MSSLPCSGFVIIVEDEEDTRELLRELLELNGFQVATAQDGVEALELLATVPHVCMMILDLLMPRMGGRELLQRLPVERTFPVWVSTSAPDKVPAGVPCLPKPVDVDQLLSLVSTHCARQASV